VAPAEVPSGQRGHRVATKLLIPLSVVLIVIVLVFFVLFETAFVEGESMEPALFHADRLLVTRGYDEPLLGDIVIISAKRQGEAVGLVKRVAALPGDVVAFEGAFVAVNGEPVPSAMPAGREWPGPVGTLTVPDGSVFVLSDNRPGSKDSRHYGPVSVSDIDGRAFLIFAPITRVSLVDGSPSRD
jgi:signal peptidase I